MAAAPSVLPVALIRVRHSKHNVREENSVSGPFAGVIYMKTLFLAAAGVVSFGFGTAHADVISNPNTGSNVGPLCGWPYQGGACQTVFIGESFAAPITGSLTNLQFSLLGGSTLSSVQAIVYALNGPLNSSFIPGAEIWRSAAVAGSAGTLDFNPVGVTLTAGQNYVAFLSTYYLTGTGQANVSSCNPFIGGLPARLRMPTRTSAARLSAAPAVPIWMSLPSPKSLTALRTLRSRQRLLPYRNRQPGR